MLEIKNLSVSVGDIEILKNINLSLGAGDSIGIVGESGSGKSTLASAIVGLLPTVMSSSGNIILDGEEILGISQRRMRQLRRDKVAFIPQDPTGSLNPVFNIENQMGEMLSGSKQERRNRILNLLTEVKVTEPEHRLKVYPHTLSGGIKQRIVGAMGLSFEPKLLIADEPTTALDVTVQAEYLNLLTELRIKHGFALMLISHDLGVISGLCENVAVMYAGEIVEYGKKQDVFNNPQHPYTKSLLGSRPSLDHDIEWLPENEWLTQKSKEGV